MIDHFFRRPKGTRAIEGAACEQLLYGAEGGFWQEQFCGAFAQTQAPAVARVGGEPVGVAALDAVHFAGILGFGAIEKPRSGLAAAAFQIGHLKRAQVCILCVCDFGLPAEGEVAHRHAIRAIGVGSNGDTPRSHNRIVGGDHVGAGAGFGRADKQPVFRHIQLKQSMLQLAD